MPSKVAQILPLNLTSPGINGLNTTTSMAGDVGDWLFEATNSVFTKERNIAPREQFFEPSTSYVTPIAENTTYAGFAGTDYFVYGNGKIYVKSGTDLSTFGNNGNAVPAWASVFYWKVVHLNGKYFFFHDGVAPLVYAPYAGPPLFSGIPTGPTVGVAHSAFGRVWAASISPSAPTLYWSLLLDGETWTGAGTGSLNLHTYLNADERVTCIHDFNNHLIVFTQSSILIFENPFDVPVDSSGTGGTAGSLRLKEKIEGAGCLSVVGAVSVGEECFFISQTGLMKMSQVVADGGSNPVKTALNQVRTGITNEISEFDFGTYYAPLNYLELSFDADQGFLMLNILYTKQFLIWLNHPIENGGYAVTTWETEQTNTDVGVIWTKICSYYRTGGTSATGAGATAWLQVYDSTATSIDYQGIATYGQAQYTYPDDSPCETNGFLWTVKSPWLNFGDQQDFQTKILKRLLVVHRRPRAKFDSGLGYTPTNLTVDFKIRTDYNDATYNFTFTGSYQEYNPNILVLPSYQTQTVPLAGAGSLIQYELSAIVSDPGHMYFALQRLSFQAKLGRIQQGI
jgi:hypothetical protein